jgi:hypothetical protein
MTFEMTIITHTMGWYIIHFGNKGIQPLALEKTSRVFMLPGTAKAGASYGAANFATSLSFVLQQGAAPNKQADGCGCRHGVRPQHARPPIPLNRAPTLSNTVAIPASQMLVVLGNRQGQR